MENQPINKREEYLLKRQQKEETRLKQASAKKIKKSIVFIIPAILILGGVAFGASKINFGSSQEEGSGPAKIEINPKEYDAGTVSMAAGLVKKIYEIKNAGDRDLKISNMSTSCHCTTAILTVGDKASSEFGMNGSAFWSQIISPGQTGFLEVIFDPAYHGPSGLGYAVRAVSFLTNDPKNKKAEVRLNADVVQ